MIKACRKLALCLAALCVVGLGAGCKRVQSEPRGRSVPNRRPLAVLDLVRMQQAGAFAELPVQIAEVSNDPAYKAGIKRFRGYALKDILAQSKASHGRGESLRVHLLARDGYQTELQFAANDVEGAVLAFEDVDAPLNEQWQSFRSGKRWITPAPFYLVWSVSDARHRPWPYQLERIEIWSNAAKDAAYPSHALSAQVGYRAFRAQCMSCHSINLVGGSLGPELNVPKNVLEYRDASLLRAYIRNAGAFHARSVMPAFEHLSQQELDFIIGYLRAMARAKVCNSVTACQSLYAPVKR